MFKLMIVLVLAIAYVSAKPLVHSVTPVVTSAAIVEPVVTATSSQFVARNYGYAAPLVASPYAYSAPYVASPYVASPYAAAYTYPATYVL